MKKTLIAVALATATLGFTGMASAGYDLGAACNEARPADSEVPVEAWAAACSCVVEKTAGDEATLAAFENAEPGDRDAWTQEGRDAIDACFAPPAE